MDNKLIKVVLNEKRTTGNKNDYKVGGIYPE
jgi:hypothetical protein